MADPASDTDIAGSAYKDLVREQLEEERRRKDSLERKGASVITTSAFLGSILFGLATWAVTSKTTTVAVTWAVGVSLALFLVAAFFGVSTNWLKNFDEVKLSALPPYFEDEKWFRPGSDGEWEVTQTWYDILVDARNKNNEKVRLLKIALGAEALATTAVLVAVLLILLTYS
jgi:disulfide bond formation protein DsbB